MWFYSEQEPECEDSSKVTEEAILDSLFYGCDPENTGRVPVSRLVEFLRDTICGENGEVSTLFPMQLNFAWV